MADTYAELLRRRVDQFAFQLRQMDHRAHDEAKGSCFIIFEERKRPGCATSSQSARALLAASVGRGATDDHDAVLEGISDDAWRQDDSMNRFVQFSIEKNWFCMDLPLQTLFKPEASRILRDRSGFFYLRDHPEFTLKAEDVDGYDPFRKVYLYGDEKSAAEDMAYIFFSVWNFPPDSQLYVTASAFGDGPSFEDHEPLN